MAEKSDIMHHYDDDFKFFEPIIGKSLAYSCGDWSVATSLEEAQVEKFKKILSYAGAAHGVKTILDLGSGWGSLLNYAARNNLADYLCGVTISPGQAEYSSKSLQKFNCDIVEGNIFDFFHEYAGEKFDCAASIGAFEHFSNPKEFKKGEHIERYRSFFNGVKKIVKGKFALQTIVTLKNHKNLDAEERKKAFKIYYFLSKHIFPNSLTPPLGDVFEAIKDIYTIERYEVCTSDYAKTLRSWSANLDAVRDSLNEEVYDRYKKYFDLTAEQYENGALAIARFSLNPVRNK